jgi:arylsulfatase A-like enzyme
VVTSDHGTELLDHGRFGKSPEHLYAHNTQLNWIVRLPDAHPLGPGGRGRTIDAFAQNHDVAPTILDMVGLLDAWPGATAVDRPEWAGRSMLPLIEGRPDRAQPAQRDHVITGWGEYASVRDRDWNYTVNFENPAGTERLYDLRDDPLEAKDVAADHPDVVRERRRRLEALLGQELPAKLEDPNQQSTIGPCRVYFGSRPTRAQERAGFV